MNTNPDADKFLGIILRSKFLFTIINRPQAKKTYI